MTRIAPLVLAGCAASSSAVLALTSNTINQQSAIAANSQFVPRNERSEWRTELRFRRPQWRNDANQNKTCLNPCPEPEDDALQDRLEAVFAGTGALWAGGGPGAAVVAQLFSFLPMAAESVLPNMPSPQAVNRAHNKQQCLVDPLSTRECSVYQPGDDVDFLDRGADAHPPWLGTPGTGLDGAGDPSGPHHRSEARV